MATIEGVRERAERHLKLSLELVAVGWFLCEQREYDLLDYTELSEAPGRP